MVQSQLATTAGTGQAPVSPLLISDRLISLAEQAGQVGCTATARHLIRLASRVLEEKTGFAPLAGSTARR